MSNTKSILSLTMLVLLGLSVVSDANAESARNTRITNKHIQACVAEIGRHADYREYRVSCITGAMHDLVRFRIAPLDNNN